MVSIGTAIALLLSGCVGGGADAEPTTPSEADYRAAVEQTRQCVQEAGYQVGEIGKAPDGKSLQFTISTPPGEEQHVDAVYAECEDEYLTEIASVYLASVHLTGAEREQAMAELVDCLEDAGVTGLSVAETDSRVFVRAIMADGPDSSMATQGLLCFDRYRDVWPPGDPNNP